MAEQFFEMLWDCEQCETRGLLGKSQRHCPLCGAAQNPARRYFPEPGQEKEALGHRFVGVDWACAYCESPNSAAAAFCVNCGGPKEKANDVARVVDKAAPTPTSSTPTPTPTPRIQALQVTPGRSSGVWWFLGLMSLVLVACAVFVFQLFSKHDESVQLVEKSWDRAVEVEHFAALRQSAWCDALPAGAYEVTRAPEQRSTRKVEAGQDCVDSRVDMGDGTFTKRHECTPRYRNEPVFDEKCSYRINRWQVLRADRLTGGASLAPAWPVPLLANPALGGERLGAQRLGSRSETYRVKLQSAAGEVWTCDLAPAAWSDLAENQHLTMKVRGTGGADCSSLVASR